MEVVTPKADGTIMNGITRANIIDIINTRDPSFKTQLVERDMSLVEVYNSHKEGRLRGAFTSSSEHGVQTITDLNLGDNMETLRL
jgi:branched-subunit amino acid aminotransferase/4-amino-4-deoxychorismate lyase